MFPIDANVLDGLPVYVYIRASNGSFQKIRKSSDYMFDPAEVDKIVLDNL